MFKRGRYGAPDASGDEDTPNAAAKRNEQERFTAAALAFCFKHDSTFRQHFWDRICRSDGDSSTPDSIELEPCHSADLLVRSGSPLRRVIHVIECKVGADLKPHQDPRDPAFITTGGYGFKLRQYVGELADLKYIVLGLRRTLNLPEADPTLRIRFAEKGWSDLEGCMATTPLMKDLFNSLGEMRVGRFHMSKTKNIPPITTGLQSVGNACDVIRDTLLDCFGVNSVSKFDVGSRGDGASILGAWAPNGWQARLQDVTKLWLGYYTAADAPVLRVVYLYSADEASARRWKRTLDNRFPTALADKDEVGWHVVIEDDSASGASDFEWFSSVLKQAEQPAAAES